MRLACSILACAAALCAQNRVVAVGDVHGDFARFTEVLRAAGVIDARNKWSGGKTRLVQTGDVPDRGPDSRKVMDLLMSLEREAKKTGGAVHALIGNHEAMNVYGDLRYVAPGEYEAFRTKDSAKLRDEFWERQPAGLNRPQWEAARPLGWLEHRLAFSADGLYGKWVRRHDAIAKVGDAVFLHGGLAPKYEDWTVDAINRQIREQLDSSKLGDDTILGDPDGPLWYRGLAAAPEAELAAHVDRLLAKHGVRRIVIAHTPAPAVLPRFGGKVLTIDTGLSKAYGGPPACLVLEDGKASTIHRGKMVAIPDSAAGVEAYLRQLAELDPPPSPILRLLAAPVR